MQKKFETPKRSNSVRLLVVFFALITAFGLTELGRHGQEQRRAEVVTPNLAFSNANLEKENETERMPVRFDDGLRTQAVSGL